MIWKAWIGDWRGKLANNLVAGWKTTNFKNTITTQIQHKEGITLITDSKLQEFFNYVKKAPIIKVGSKYYRAYDKYGGEGSQATVVEEHFITPGSTAYDAFYGGLDLTPAGYGGDDKIEGTPGPETFSIRYKYTKHEIGFAELFSECKAKIPANVPLLKDAPYHMFAIPYSDDLALYIGDTLHCVTNKSVAMTAAQALATSAGAGAVYDVQLLPYCPVRDIIKTTKVTNHYEIVNMDGILTISGWFQTNYKVKPNQQYVLRKDITLDYETNSAYGINSNSIIYCR